MKYINYKIIIIHMLGAILFILSFRQLVPIYDIELTNAFIDNGEESIKKFGAQRLTNYIFAQALIPFLGLIISILVSLVITYKKQYVNTIIVFIIVYFLRFFGLLDLNILTPIITFPGELFFDSRIYIFIFNAIVLLALGFSIFFSKYSRNLSNKTTYNTIYSS